APVVGLEARVAELHPAASQVREDDLGEELRIGQRTFLREGQVVPARDHLSGRVLVARQPQPLRLRPQLGDVAQVFGIYASLLEEPPRCLHLSQALLRLMLPALLLHEPFVAPDRPKRLLRERQTEVALHALSAPGRELALERDGPPALPRRDAA